MTSNRFKQRPRARTGGARDRVGWGGRVQQAVDEAAVGGLSSDDVQAAYRTHAGELYRFLLRGLGERWAAQDVLQETFLKAWRAADRFDPTRSSVRVWLFGIARHAMIDHARASQVRPWQRLLLDGPVLALSAEMAADPSEALVEQWFVEEALCRVSEQHRVAITLTHLEGRPYEEVAAELGIPVGTLRSRVFYGLRALRVAALEMGATR